MGGEKQPEPGHFHIGSIQVPLAGLATIAVRWILTFALTAIDFVQKFVVFSFDPWGFHPSTVELMIRCDFAEGIASGHNLSVLL